MTAPSFQHDAPGTPEADWASQQWLLDLPCLALPAPDTAIVVLAAHPDDESLGAGGLIATAAGAGHRVVVLLASDGEGSHPDAVSVSPEQLRGIRRAEALDAVAALGEGIEVIQLGLPDGRLAEHRPAISRALVGVFGSAPAWLVTPWQDDGHPDHAACDRAGADATANRPDVRHFSYPIWWWHWARPDDASPEQRRQARQLPLSEHARSRKRVALARYRSQHEPLGPAAGDQPVLTTPMLEHFERAEEILIDRGRHPAAGADYFETLYASSGDPWDLAERHYEQRKRDIVLASLPHARFERGFEPGCATGQLSIRLAERCAELICYDIAPAALAQATTRLRHLPRVSFEVGRIPDDWPAGTFDLIVLSEVAYYCQDLATLATRISTSLSDDGTLLLVHWRWPAIDHPLTAETVHATLSRRCGLHPIVEHQEADFILQVLTRTGRSVAQRERLVP